MQPFAIAGYFFYRSGEARMRWKDFLGIAKMGSIEQRGVGRGAEHGERGTEHRVEEDGECSDDDGGEGEEEGQSRNSYTYNPNHDRASEWQEGGQVVSAVAEAVAMQAAAIQAAPSAAAHLTWSSAMIPTSESCSRRYRF